MVRTSGEGLCCRWRNRTISAVSCGQTEASSNVRALAGGHRDRIVLLAPSFANAAGYDLALENALDGPIDGSAGLRTALVVEPLPVFSAGGGVLEHVQYADHRAVVERDVPVISVGMRVPLRKAAAGELRGQQPIEAAQAGGADLLDVIVAAIEQRAARGPDNRPARGRSSCRTRYRLDHGWLRLFLAARR